MKWFSGKCGSNIEYGHISTQHQVGIFNFNLRAIKKKKKTLTLIIFLCKLLGKKKNKNQKPLHSVWDLEEVGNALFVALV